MRNLICFDIEIRMVYLPVWAASAVALFSLLSASNAATLGKHTGNHPASRNRFAMADYPFQNSARTRAPDSLQTRTRAIHMNQQGMETFHTSVAMRSRCSDRRKEMDLGCLCYLGSKGLFQTDSEISDKEGHMICEQAFGEPSKWKMSCKLYRRNGRISVSQATSAIRFTVQRCSVRPIKTIFRI